ncbi:hypothetical protein Holit_00572 [Hollandina sp. SP2]
MEYGHTSHNRTVYASPPVGGSGYGLARSLRFAPFPRKTSATFYRPWSCCASPYSGRQNVIYSRDVMCNTPLKFSVNYYGKYIG